MCGSAQDCGCVVDGSGAMPAPLSMNLPPVWFDLHLSVVVHSLSAAAPPEGRFAAQKAKGLTQ